MQLWDRPLNHNDIRQGLRTALGATLGFFFCKFFNFSFGAFFVVMPIMLLGLNPFLSGYNTRQLIASGVISGLEVGILGGIFGGSPTLMTLIVFTLFLSKFYCMAKGPLFFFGVNSVLSLSIMLNFASYPTTNVADLISANLTADIVAVVIAYLMHWLIPNTEPRQPQPMATDPKELHRIRHETLLGTIVATTSFVIFQNFNLNDSLSAQSTSVLLLFPMNWNGALTYSRKRATGAFFGVIYGLFFQILLYDRSGELLLIIPVMLIGAMLFIYIHLKEGRGSGVGFGGLTTLGILFGQYLTPTTDLTFSALYRVSSILFSIIVTLSVIFIVHRMLNTFQITRYGQ
jgi:hypothetical protein